MPRIALYLCLLAAFVLPASGALAQVCTGCPDDCKPAGEVLKSHHEKGEKDIIKDWQNYPNIVKRMTTHKDWTVNTFFLGHWLPKLMNMSAQLGAAAIDQMRLVGLLFDAKHLLETDRTLQEMQVQANKDYQPSESFCWFGTNIRSLAETENRARFTQAALGQMELSRQLGTFGVGSTEDGEDLKSRWMKFRSTYCDPKDNNWFGGGSGLDLACGAGGADPARKNGDIDYTRMVETPRTLKVDFNKDQAAALSPDEEDVFALASNLYGHRTPTRKMEGLAIKESGAQPFYLQLRSVLAKRAVAQDSFNAIVGLKAEAETEGDTSRFLSAVVRDAGLDPADVSAYLGDKPSTYAQLEVLSQRMFQNPDFFVTLYDKPVNVKRKKAALNAIELMLDRYLYESELRQEMLLSVLLSSSSKREFDDALKNVQRQNQQQ
jgi:hypothetical protein